MTTPHSNTQPACPRCGYDLSGEIARWETSCPTDGLCTECGLDFAWRDLLSPRFATPRDSLEHAPGGFLKLGLINKPAARTWLRTLRPWVLWSHLRMEHPIRWRRLLLVLVLFALPGVVFISLAGGAVGGVSADQVFTHGAWSGWAVGWLPSLGAAPLDVTLHTIYGLLIPVHPLWHVAGFERSLIPITFAPLLAHSIMGASFLTLFQTLDRIKVRRAHLVRGVAYGAGFGMGISLLFMGSLGLAACFSEFGNMGALFGRASPWYTPLVEFFGAGIDAHAFIGLTVYGLLALWLPLHWWCFATRYLRLPRATLIVCVMTVITGLAMATVLIFASLPV